MNKPSLKDRRREEAREALYRADLRQNKIIDSLVRNTERIKKLRRALTRLEPSTGDVISKQPLSVAQGKLLDEAEALYHAAMLNDDISDVGGKS